MKRLHWAFLIASALMCPPAFAGLVDAHFDEKSEADIAAEFEEGLGPFLEKRLTETVKPRIRMEENRQEVYLELTGVDGEKSTWQTLVPHGWYEETLTYAYRPHGESFTYTTTSLPPEQIAGWYRPAHRQAAELVGLAVWLAKKDKLELANRKLAELAEASDRLKEDIDEWLAEKHGWEVPEDGLKPVGYVDIRSGEEVTKLLAGDALEKHEDELEDIAKELFDHIEDHSAGSRGKPGYRRGTPKVRLVVLQRWIEQYREQFAETRFMENRRNQRKLDDLEEAVKADLEFVETEKFKAERKGIDGDWEGAAEAYEVLYRADPKNPDIVMQAGSAWSKSAGISDAGRKCEDPKAAARAAALFEELVAIYPMALSYRNHAGVNYLASGDKRKAREHHEFVVKATDDRSDLSENDKGNREYAQNQLEVIG